MKNPFPYSDSNKRYHTYTCFLSRRFGGKVSRVPLNAGFTCPNRDGTIGEGGCTFCNNGAFTPSYCMPSKLSLIHI